MLKKSKRLLAGVLISVFLLNMWIPAARAEDAIAESAEDTLTEDTVTEDTATDDTPTDDTPTDDTLTDEGLIEELPVQDALESEIGELENVETQEDIQVQSVAGVQNKINELRSIYPSGSYFTANGRSCGAVPHGSCNNCKLSNVLANRHPSYVGKMSGERWSCCAFATFAFYYIFGYPVNGSASNPTNLTLVGYSLSVAKPGDFLVYGGGTHYGIYLSNNKIYDSNGYSDKSACQVKYENTSPSLGVKVYRATNYDSINPPSPPPTLANLGTNFTGIILNTASWKPIELVWPNVRLGTENGHMNERWRFDRMADGSYKITNLENGLVLDNMNFGTSNGNNIAGGSDNGSTAQRWFIYNTKNGYRFTPACAPGMSMDLATGATADGTNIQLWTSNDTPAQEFSVWQISSPALANLGNDFYAPIIHTKSWKSLGVNDDGNVNYQENADNKRNMWHFQQNPGGDYVIKSLWDGKVLATKGGNVCVELYTGASNQKWYALGESAMYLFRTLQSNQVIEVAGGTYYNGVNAQLGNAQGSEPQKHQVWYSDMKNPTLTATTSASKPEVTLKWNLVLAAKKTTVKIWKNATASGTPFVEQANVAEQAFVKTLPNGTYSARVEVTNALNTRKSQNVTFTIKNGVVDTVKPEIKEVKVKRVKEDGYELACKVTDNIKVDSVKVRVWREGQNEKDAKVVASQTYEDGSVSCEVAAKDFASYKGIYYSKIYAYDAAGNESVFVLNKIDIKNRFSVQAKTKLHVGGKRELSWTYTGTGNPSRTEISVGSRKVVDIRDGKKNYTIENKMLSSQDPYVFIDVYDDKNVHIAHTIQLNPIVERVITVVQGTEGIKVGPLKEQQIFSQFRNLDDSIVALDEDMNIVTKKTGYTVLCWIDNKQGKAMFTVGVNVLKDSPFTDIQKGDWYYDSVNAMFGNGLMTGLTEKKFAPNSNLARAQFAVILYRMSGEPPVQYTAKFKDVPNGQWYTNAVLWANSIGVVNGYSSTGLFGPSDNINREQMAVMMYRYAKHQKYDVSKKADFSKFTDASSVSSFSKEAMQWAVGNQLITGKDNGKKLDPQGNASRAECGAIVTRFMAKYYK